MSLQGLPWDTKLGAKMGQMKSSWNQIKPKLALVDLFPIVASKHLQFPLLDPKEIEKFSNLALPSRIVLRQFRCTHALEAPLAHFFQLVMAQVGPKLAPKDPKLAPSCGQVGPKRDARPFKNRSQNQTKKYCNKDESISMQLKKVRGYSEIRNSHVMG